MQQVGRSRDLATGAAARTEAARLADARHRKAVRLGRATRRIGRRVLIAAAAVGVIATGVFARYQGSSVIEHIDRLIASIGLRADQIAVVSASSGVLDDVALVDVFAALAVDEQASLFSYSTAKARERLQQLPWIESADVRRVLPSGLDVVIEARHPVAVWQTRGMLFLVDGKGHVLAPATPADRNRFALLVGEGANLKAAEIIELIKRYPEIASRMTAATRVGDRRWNIDLKDGPRLLLPADDPAKALDLVSELQVAEQLLERAVTEVDLRIAGSMSLRLEDDAANSRRDSHKSRIAAAKPGRGA